MIEETANIRIDLLGGTLDLRPINIILKNVVTLNATLDIAASVRLERTKDSHVLIESLDYKKQITLNSSDSRNSKNLGPFELTAAVLDYFQINSGLKITLKSDSPTGAGLGGSSAVSVALYKALCTFMGNRFDPIRAINVLNAIEGRILASGPAGYQDYYPAIYGGVLALKPKFDQVQVIQLYCDELKKVLEERLTLVYSGQSRLSGMNNWEIYKGFFDNSPPIREKLQDIADLSYKSLDAIEKRRYNELIELVGQEGEVRRELFPDIVSEKMQSFWDECRKDFPSLGLKVCGAGGGGCFLLVHKGKQREALRNRVRKTSSMMLMDFSLCGPKADKLEVAL